MRWLTNFHDFRFKITATAAIGIQPTKSWLTQLVNFKNAIWHLGKTICNKIVLNLEQMPPKRIKCFRVLFDHLAWIEHQFLSSIRDSRNAESLWGMMRGLGGVRKSIHQSWLAKGLWLGLGLLRWCFKGVQEEIPSEEASTLQIGSVTFPAGQYTSPQLHPCHRLIWLRWASRQLLTLAIVQTLLPVTFDYSLSSELSLWDDWGDERGCDEGHWHAHTRRRPWGLAEVVGTVQQVHWSRRRLLRRGLEFHVCTINKSAHMKKVMLSYWRWESDSNNLIEK